jgi:hypothetical protein
MADDRRSEGHGSVGDARLPPLGDSSPRTHEKYVLRRFILAALVQLGRKTARKRQCERHGYVIRKMDRYIIQQKASGWLGWLWYDPPISGGPFATAEEASKMPARINFVASVLAPMASPARCVRYIIPLISGIT